jgi:PAS domain S-box-containing protein
LARDPAFDDIRGHLASIVDSSDDAILSKDLDGIIQSCNRSGEQLFGYAAEELIGRPVTILIPPELQAEERYILARLRRGERVEHFETVRVAKDGRRLDISLTVSPIRDSSGRIVGASKVARDITERKRAAAELAAQREWLRITLVSIGDAVIASDPSGRVTLLNPVAETLTGWTAAEAAGKPLAEVFHIINEETRGRVENPTDKVIETGHVVGLANHTVLVSRDGRERPIEDSAAPIFDEQRRIIGVVLVFHDVTEKRRAEDAMAEQHEWLQTTLESIGDGVLATDRHGVVVFLNAVAERLIGRRAGEVRGRHCRDVLHLIHEVTRQTLESPVDRVLRDKQPVAVANHTVLVTPDGRERPIDDSAAPIVDRTGALTGVVMVFRDVTDRRHAATERERLLHGERAARADAERASRLKDEFVAMVSHELRTPLNAIVGWAHMLRKGDLDAATTHRAIDTIDRNARSQSRLISDLLDLSRILSGKLDLENRLVDLTTVLENAAAATQPGAAEKGVTLTAAADTSNAEVVGDPTRLQQVLLNLLTNAIKFTPAGGRVEMNLRREGDYAVLTVRDTGKGIEPEFLPHVFDRFRQADASTTRRHGGLGLGLTIVRHLVELHRGRVRAESRGPGQGATFTISLPLAASAAADSSVREVPDTDACAPDLLAGQRILVVDDEPDTLELLTYSLGQCGAEVASAGSVSEALDVFARFRPHLLISDIGMPEQDGYDLIRAVRSRPADAGGIVPAVAVTAFVGRDDRERALAAGFQEHIGKPVAPAVLATVVADLLRSQAPTASTRTN